ncbi:MAG: hypothetical protein HUU20_29525 [Pirellulales bacterium]|nr:hypothetical protein [Pirellulales bacterium]
MIVLVALLVAFAVLVSIVRLAAAERQAWRTQTWQTQAAWLAESGLERAAARLHDDPKYQGETWIVPAEVFGGRWSGKVTIQVATLADQPAQRQIRVQADYPDDPQDRARRTRDAVLRIPQ